MDLRSIWNSKKMKWVIVGVGVLVVGGILFLSYQKGRDERLSYTSLVKKSEQNRLLTEFSKLIDEYVKGGMTVEDRNNRIEELIARFNPDGDAEKAKHLRTIIKVYSPLFTSGFVMPMILKKAYGYELSDKERQGLQSLNLGGVDVETYVENQVRAIGRYIQKLKEYKISYDPGGGWDLSHHLSPAKIKEDAGLFQAIALLISPQIAAALADENRQEAILIGERMYLPPISRDEAKSREQK